jgi:hypothetical protein
MLNNFLGARHRNKKFNYAPRHYDPTRDERIRDRIRLQSSSNRGRGGNVLLYILLLSGILWIMVTLS